MKHFSVYCILYSIYFASLISAQAAIYPLTYVSSSREIPDKISLLFSQAKKDIFKAARDKMGKTLQIIGFQSLQNLPNSGGHGWYLVVRVLDSPMDTSLDSITCMGVILTEHGKLLECSPVSPVSFCYLVKPGILCIADIHSLASPRHEFRGHEMDIDILLANQSTEPVPIYTSNPDDENDFDSKTYMPTPGTYTVNYFSDFNQSESIQLLAHEWVLTKNPTQKWTFFTFDSTKMQYLETPISDDKMTKYISVCANNPQIIACELYPSKVYDLSSIGIKTLGLNVDDVLEKRMANLH